MTGFAEQPARRTVPGYVNVLGEATNTASVSVNTNLAYRKDRYFRAELSVDNTANPVWLGITNVAVMPVGSGNYVISNVTSRVFVSKTPEAFTYDADGNLTQDGRWNYTWDGENRLVKVESRTTTPLASWRRVEWQYDALGRRIRQITSDGSSGTWQGTEDLKFVSDPVLFGRHIAELNTVNGALVHSYVWGLDLSGSLAGAGGVGGLLAVHVASTLNNQPSTHFVADDGNGNIMALTAASDGSETARYEYGPFGEPLRLTGPMALENPFRFSTKRTANTTDLVLNEYTAPTAHTLGCWPNRDPLLADEGLLLGHELTAFNQVLQSASVADVKLQGFGRNDPVGKIGPFGLLPFDGGCRTVRFIQSFDVDLDAYLAGVKVKIENRTLVQPCPKCCKDGSRGHVLTTSADYRVTGEVKAPLGVLFGVQVRVYGGAS